MYVYFHMKSKTVLQRYLESDKKGRVLKMPDRLNMYLMRLPSMLILGALCAVGQSPSEDKIKPVTKSCVRCMDDLLAQPQQPVREYCWVKATPCPRNAQLLLREVRSEKSDRWNHLSLVWATVPLSAIKINVSNDQLGRLAPQKDDLIVTSGGFASCNCPEAQPVGLAIEDGSLAGNFESWQGQGGIILQRSCKGNGCVWPSPEIVRTREYQRTKDIHAALQCKPLVIENGAIAVFDQPDEYWNRIAVATHDAGKPTGTLVIAIVAADKAKAVTQYEFAYLLSKLEKFDSPIDTALQLDGAYGPAMVIPGLSFNFPSSPVPANVTRLHVVPKPH
jgi:uncharacterized protein YigE (DUF2233 family)